MDAPDPPQQTQEVRNTSEPWSAVQPYLKRLYPEVEDLYQTPTPYFPGQTLAPLAPETEAGWDLTTGRALMGSPTANLAQLEAQRTLAGEYLSPDTNPWLGDISDTLAKETMGQVGSRYGASGHRFGSPGEQEMYARTFSSALAPHLFGEYGRERDAMGRMSALAPSLAREDYFDLGQLERVGAARQGRSQQEIADEMERFYYPYREPYGRLSYGSGILHGGGALGGTTTGSTVGQMQYPSPSPLQYVGAGLQGIGNVLPFFFL